MNRILILIYSCGGALDSDTCAYLYSNSSRTSVYNYWISLDTLDYIEILVKGKKVKDKPRYVLDLIAKSETPSLLDIFPKSFRIYVH